MSDDKQVVRDELEEIGARRSRLRAQQAKLKADTEKAVKRAKAVSLPMSEVSRLTGLDRTSIYQTYVRPG